MDGSNSSESRGDHQEVEEISSNSSESSGDDQEEEESGPRRQNVIMMKMEVLECIKCSKPLGDNIFHDSDGDAICSSCRDELPESERAAAQRCRAMERIVRDSFVFCKYGCKGTVRYGKKKYEESMCPFGPCSCPISGCGFVARTAKLLDHLSTLHKLPKTPIEDLVPFRVRVQPGSQVLYTQPNLPRYLLSIESLGSYGHALYLACIRPKTPQGRFIVFVSFSCFEAHYQTSNLTIERNEERKSRCLCVVPGIETSVEVSITINMREDDTFHPELYVWEDDMEDRDYVCEEEEEEEAD